MFSVASSDGGAAMLAAEAFGADATPALAFSTSFTTMRPCGPDPCTDEISMPLSLAKRRPSGEAKTREPDAGAATGAAATGVDGTLACACGKGADAAFGAAAFGTSLSFSPSPKITAIGAFTNTSSVPSATMILPSV